MSVTNAIRALCHGCLSTDRTLYSIEKQDDLYELIKDNNLFDSKSVLLCWECAAVLMKMKLFKEQVSRAANILLLEQRGLLKMIPPCLSKLSTLKREKISIIKEESEMKEEFDDIDRNIDTNDKRIDQYDSAFGNIQETLSNIDTNTNSEIKDIKFDDQIKIEFDEDTKDFDDNEFNDEMNEFCDETLVGFDNDDELLIDIKMKEQRARIRKYNNMKQYYARKKEARIPRSQKYKFVKDLKELIDKDKINVNDIEHYIEMERNSEYYLEAKFKCELCVVKFKSEGLLNEHRIKKHDSSLPHKCVYCQSFYSTEVELQAHMKKHLVFFRCKGCTFESYTWGRMKKHTKIHKGCVKCNLCDYEMYFKNVKEFYRNHCKKYHKRFICDICGRRFILKAFLVNHMSNHKRDVVSFSCDQCGATFDSKPKLTQHLTRHIVKRDENSYCVLCDKQFDNQIKYKGHYQSVHEKWRNTKKYICPVCNKEFTKNIYMKQHHARVHEKKTDHYCVLCDKYFTRSSNLQLHIDKCHEGKKKPKDKICETCGRGFAEQSVLQKHIRTHTNERPYKCPYCPAAFNQGCPLKAHLNKQHHHKGPFPYFIKNGVVRHISEREEK